MSRNRYTPRYGRRELPPDGIPRFREETFADRLNLLLSSIGMSDSELERETGISRQAIGSMRKGVTKHPHQSSVRVIARATGANLHWLLTGERPNVTDEPDDSPDQGIPGSRWTDEFPGQRVWAASAR